MATPDGPLADVRDMAGIHTMFRREFGLMPALVRTSSGTDADRRTLVADHVALLTGFLDHHHAGEDIHIWPLLRERCSEIDAPFVELVENQHRTVHGGLESVGKSLVDWRRTGSKDAAESLANAVEQLLPPLREHLALEEEKVVPLIAEHVTDAEYSRVAQEQGADVPPEKLPVLFGMFMYETDSEVVDVVVSHMPPEVQPVIKDLATGAYAAYAEQLYGTATPSPGA